MAPDPIKRDDDSWGKLASDLFGIDLSADELDLSDIEPPPPPVAPAPPAAPAPSQPVAATPVEIDLADMDFEADDADFDEDESEDEAESAPVSHTASAVASAAFAEDEEEVDEDDEDLDDADDDEPSDAQEDSFWDALESWDWEASEAANAGPVSGESQRDRPRSDRGPRRGDRRGDRGDRPPRRGGERPRDRGREAAPSTERREPRSDRPPRREEPPRRPPVRESRPVEASDDFGEGLIESPAAPPAAHWDDELPATPRIERPRIAEEPDFDDLPAEAAADAVEESRLPADAEGRPRRRRRRRRRSSSDREAPATRVEEGAELGPAESDLEEPGEESLDEQRPVRDRAEAAEGGERRGRRRRRRRGGERPAPAGSAPSRTSAEESAGFDADEPFEEAEAVVAASYENIPTWEEAISYLLKPTGDGRRENGGGSRDRGPRRR
jgi:hypothetical protein